MTPTDYERRAHVRIQANENTVAIIRESDGKSISLTERRDHVTLLLIAECLERHHLPTLAAEMRSLCPAMVNA